MRVVVVAHPGARQERVEMRADGALAVWVRARPSDGAANAAIERTLARVLGLRPRQVVVVAGHTGRQKVVALDAPSEADIRERLRAATGLT
jgi:uncharacterized protein YggU (UPF0235/DUF167 family)